MTKKGSRVSKTSLVLENFNLRVNENCGKATVSMSVAELDRNGFVTDNRRFIEAAENFRGTLGEFAEKLPALARQQVGKRLLAVSGSVEGKAGRQTFSWGEVCTPFDPQGEVNKTSIRRTKIETVLVNHSVCGGYDGEFNFTGTLYLGVGAKKLSLQDLLVGVRTRFKENIIKASCEELACGVVHTVHTLVHEPLLAAEVKVYNLTGWAEVNWEACQQVPAFPRKATPTEIQETKRVGASREDERPSRC